VTAKRALLVIDVQQGLCDGATPPFALDDVIARINAVAAKARAAGEPVIFIQHEGTAGYLEHGTAAWQLHRDLRVEPSDMRLRKTATDSFHRTELQARLERHGVTELVVCGMHTEFCVDTTIRRALALGYPVILVADAHTSEGSAVLSPALVIAHHNDVLSNISSFGPRARPVPAADVVFAGA
jgi:nicotinamidase-related amidase